MNELLPFVGLSVLAGVVFMLGLRSVPCKLGGRFRQQ